MADVKEETISRRSPLFVLQVWAAALLSLWSIDVAVHLGLLEGLPNDPSLPARGRDFAGLLLADLLPAMALVGAGMVVSAIAVRWLRGGTWQRETVLGTAVVTLALIVLAGLRLTWGLHASDPGALLLTAIVAGVLWLALRGRDRGRLPHGWTMAELVGCIVAPSLAAAMTLRAVFLIVAGEWGTAVVDGVVATVAIAMTRALWRTPRAPRTARWGWAVTAVALLLALRVVALSAFPGRSPEHPQATTGATPPDIVLIVLDTVRADHLAHYGYARQTMPTLESWGAEALVARRALSAAGWTSPAHASIFSGLPVSLHGVHFASGRTPALSTPPVDTVVWLPQQLGELGYFRLAVSANPRAVPDIGGFSRVLAPVRHQWQLSTLGSLLDRQSALLELLNSRLRWQTPYIDAEAVTDLVTATLPDGDGPIFLFVNYLDAHSPYNPPQAALDRLGLEPGRAIHRYAVHRELTQTWEQLPAGREQDLRDLYDGELNGLDRELGRLLEWIDRRLGSETTVIITSDHGEELGEDGRVGHEFGLAQRLIHVPLWIRSPALEAGDLEELVDTRRLFDFILATARGEASAEILVREDGFGHISERYPTEHNVRSIGPGYDRPWVSLVEGGVKAVGPSTEGLELFALDSGDFSRQEHLAVSPAGAALGERIDAFWALHQDRREEAADSPAPSEEELKVLRSLGYVP